MGKILEKLGIDFDNSNNCPKCGHQLNRDFKCNYCGYYAGCCGE